VTPVRDGQPRPAGLDARLVPHQPTTAKGSTFMPERLWFRFDDIWPLAEHALHCLDHEPPAMPVGVGPAGPALVWTGTGGLDLLTSTGMPTWYGRRGTPHAAEAHTWRDPHGRSRTAGRDGGYTTAYLPLTSDSGAPGPVISLLRSNLHSGNGWVTVDIDPTDRHLMDAYRLHVVADHDELVPPAATWDLGAVTCPQVGGRTYWGMVADHTSDSGDLLVRFTRDTVEQIIADLQHPIDAPVPAKTAGQARIGLGLDGDVLAVYRLTPGHQRPHRVTDYLTADSDGRYSLGAYVWSWRYAAEPTTAGA
jgi:hypothetical protein